MGVRLGGGRVGGVGVRLGGGRVGGGGECEGGSVTSALSLRPLQQPNTHTHTHTIISQAKHCDSPDHSVAACKPKASLDAAMAIWYSSTSSGRNPIPSS